MKSAEIQIRESESLEINTIICIQKLAFRQEEEASLVYDLLQDKSAEPVLSLLAFISGKAVGHILFSRIYLKGSQHKPMMHILAPLAVVPEWQGKGVGGKLIQSGLQILKSRNTEFVFVLGYDKYYSKFGFIPGAEKHGFIPPYPIPAVHSNAWMYLPMYNNVSDIHGKTLCADSLMDPKYWVE